VRSLADAPTWTWTRCGGLEGLRTLLTTERPEAVRIGEIPRRGLVTDVVIEQALAAGLAVADAQAQAGADTVTVEQLHAVGHTTGYRVAVTWGARPDTVDAVFLVTTGQGPQHVPLTDLYLAPSDAHQRGTHANDPHTNTKISAVRQALGARLPDFMVPAQFVVLEQFPVTSSGKIDRKALPAPVFAATSFQAAQTPIEKTIAEVFAEVLGLDRVGVDDDFFALGGDSLSAMRLIAAIKTALEIDLSVPTVFEAPTVRKLSQRLQSDTTSGQEIAPIQPLKNGTGVPLFCIHAGGGVSWAYHSLGNYLDCPIVGIQQTPREEETEPRSIREMAKNYADRIQEINPNGPYNLLGWSFGGVVVHELAIELQRRGCEISCLIILDARPGFDGAAGLPDRALDEMDLLQEVVRFYRIDISDEDETISYERMEELIREQAGVELSRYQQLRDSIIRNINRNKEFYQNHEPGIFDGEMIAFSAARNENGSSALESWRPYVAGTITEYSVDCTHDDMLTAESVSLFGHQLKLSLEPPA
jgi:thioesterase domain-containing protein/acyl carrier protein